MRETKRSDSAPAYWDTVPATSIPTYARFAHTWARRFALTSMSDMFMKLLCGVDANVLDPHV